MSVTQLTARQREVLAAVYAFILALPDEDEDSSTTPHNDANVTEVEQ